MLVPLVDVGDLGPGAPRRPAAPRRGLRRATSRALAQSISATTSLTGRAAARAPISNDDPRLAVEHLAAPPPNSCLPAELGERVAGTCPP
jgi:hypothetical protein